MVRYLKSLARPMGRIHVDFGEPVRLDAAPDPGPAGDLEDRLPGGRGGQPRHARYVSGGRLQCAIRRLPRALTEPEIVKEVSIMTEWATARGVRLSPDFNLNYAEEIGAYWPT